MAIARFSAIIDQASGSVGSITFRRVRSTDTISNRARTRRPGSDAQLQALQAVTDASHAWQRLDEDQRDHVRQIAKSFPLPNQFAIKRQIPGQSLFAAARFRALADNIILADAPTTQLQDNAVDPIIAVTFSNSAGLDFQILNNSAQNWNYQLYVARTFRFFPARGPRSWTRAGFWDLGSDPAFVLSNFKSAAGEPADGEYCWFSLRQANPYNVWPIFRFDAVAPFDAA